MLKAVGIAVFSNTCAHLSLAGLHAYKAASEEYMPQSTWVLFLLSRCTLIQFSKCGSDLAATILPWELVVFQSLSCVWLFVTPWTAAHQASLSIINSQSLLKLTSIELVMPSNYLIICCPLLLPSIFPNSGVFSMSQFFTSGGQSIGVSASTSVLPMNTQDSFSLGWTGWISLQCKGH